jgi:hypothetical protein
MKLATPGKGLTDHRRLAVIWRLGTFSIEVACERTDHVGTRDGRSNLVVQP